MANASPGLVYGLFLSLSVGCVPSSQAADKVPAPAQGLSGEPAGEVRTAVFAAGCFWCVEAVFEEIDGVREVVSGYAGGTKDTAQYRKVASGSTRHAEAVRITYAPARVRYADLLHVLFSTHDPTTKDRQGPDRGPQYRSAIFYASAEEKKVAEAYIAQLTKAQTFKRPIVTTLEPLDEFYEAEAYHQDFVRRNPNHPYVRRWAVPKVDKVKKVFMGQRTAKAASAK